MATIIKLKRGTSTPTTSDLANGEVGIDTSAKKFYINDSGTIKEIAGGASSGDSTSPLSGDVRGYTGDGSTTGFTVTSGATVENVLVFLNGVFQRPTTDFTVSSTTLTFGTAPVNGDVITIKELVEGQNTFNDNPVVRAYTGDGSTTGFVVTANKTVDQFLVFLNGVFQRPTTDFSYSGTTLTFGTAPANADVISIKELAESAGNLLTIVDDSSTDKTLQIIRSYAQRDERIIVLENKQNKKLPKTLNIAHKKANGDFITWTSHDNMLKKDFLSILLVALFVSIIPNMNYSGLSFLLQTNKLEKIK